MHLESVVGSFDVEPDQVFHEDHIERLRLQQRRGMEVHELFLDRPVEPLAVGVHLRRSRIRMVMREVEFVELLREVLLEFTAVVGEDVLKRYREDHAAEGEEFLRSLRGV